MLNSSKSYCLIDFSISFFSSSNNFLQSFSLYSGGSFFKYSNNLPIYHSLGIVSSTTKSVDFMNNLNLLKMSEVLIVSASPKSVSIITL